MPTPNLYANGDFDPFATVPTELQSNRVEVLYYTDRQPEDSAPDHPAYGYRRSRSAAFGISELTIGPPGMRWDDLVKASRETVREAELPLAVTHTRELGRFAATPRKLFESMDFAAAVATTRTAPDVSAAENAFRKELADRLALTPTKEVYVFVHGFANSFDDSIQTIGQLWHFFGRRGVPIAYTWPAGSPGLLSYMYDRESSEFTVYHFRQMLRLIASCPEVQEINIICHSRGTDVVSAGLRELCLEIRDNGPNARHQLKLGAVAMAAPDLDFDVVVQRMATEPIVQLADQFVIYVRDEDKALGISNWLFGGAKRLGHMNSGLFTSAELKDIRDGDHVEFIDADIRDIGGIGHDYFHSNPAVSSDLILLMRYHCKPGASSGRPLRTTDKGFWDIDDEYPGPPKPREKQDSPQPLDDHK
jgi:esterase/lipase superfamily enzyme